MALVGKELYIANSDALLRFPYKEGQTAITAPGVKVMDLPGGSINHHWTKNVVASPDGKFLYVSVGSNSNVGENGEIVPVYSNIKLTKKFSVEDAINFFKTESIGKTRVKVQTKDAEGKAVTTTVVKDRVRAPATVVRYMAALSHALNTAVTEWGWLEKSPMVGVKKPKVDNERRSFLSDEEIQRVLTAAKESENRFLHTIVLLALSTGMRQSEIMTLRWRNVLVEDGADMGLLVMEKTKNGDARTAPLAEDAFNAVMVLRDKAIKNNAGRVPAGQLLFPSDTVDNKPVEIRKAWETCRKRAGLDDFRFHDLRHTAGSLLAMSGASTREIAEVLGHKTMAMAKRYSHLTQKHLGSVVAAMNQRLKAKKEPLK